MCDARISTASGSELDPGVDRAPGASLATARGTDSAPQCLVKLSMSLAIIEELQKTYIQKREAIRARLAEFESILLEGDDERLFEELVFCIFTAGANARLGLNSIDRIRPHLFKAGQKRLCMSLVGAHRYPNARAGYVVHTRTFLKRDCGLRLRERLDSFGDDVEARRDFFAKNPGVK